MNTALPSTASLRRADDLPAPFAPRPGLSSRFCLPVLAGVGVLAIGLIAARRFGFWSPWEIDKALAAQQLVRSGRLQLELGWAQRALTALSLGLFGLDEWAARLPNCLAGLLMLGFLWRLLAPVSGPRTAFFAGAVAASTPLFWLNSLSLLGDAVAIAAHTAVGLTAMRWLWPPPDKAAGASRIDLGLAAASLLLAIAAATATAGMLQGVLAPLAAAALAGWLLPSPHRRRLLCLSLLLAGVLGAVGWTIVRDQPSYTLWLGGSAQGLQAPGFEQIFSYLLHTLAPWSAWLPFALGGVWTAYASRQSGDPRARSLVTMLTLWGFLATATFTLYGSRYGQPTMLSLAPWCALIAIFLAQLDVQRESARVAAVACLLAVLWVWRDTLLYPASPLQSWSIATWTLPETFHPRLGWSLVFAAFALATWLTLVEGGQTPEPIERPRPLAPQPLALWRHIGWNWQRGGAFRLWTAAAVLIAVGLLAFGIVAWSLPLGVMPSVVSKWGRRLMWLPPSLWLASLLGPWLRSSLQRRLAAWRSAPVLAAGIAFGLYTAFWFLPAVSAHFSPREALQPLAALIKRGEPLAVYRLPPQTTQLYTGVTATELTSTAQVEAFLGGAGRRWVAFPDSELGALDRAFRGRTGRHLFLADYRPARAVVAANVDEAGVTNANPLARIVFNKPPAIRHRLDVLLGDQVELMGYNLHLPQGNYVGGGEHVRITWYWRSLKPVPGNWQVFLHIDGRGPRIHGDHDIAGGLYPMQLWRPGDIVVDEQSIRIPSHYGIDSPTMYVGLYNGSGRMRVVRGPHDAEDRIVAGPLHVR